MKIWLSHIILNLHDSKNFNKEGESSFYKVSVSHTVSLGNITSLSLSCFVTSHSYIKCKHILAHLTQLPSVSFVVRKLLLCTTQASVEPIKNHISTKFRGDMYNKLMLTLPALPVEICPTLPSFSRFIEQGKLKIN